MLHRTFQKAGLWRRRMLALALSTSLVLGLGLAGCGTGNKTPDKPTGNPTGGSKLRLSVSSFPVYCFARAVMGSGEQIQMLLPPGADIHNYEPSAEALAQAAKSDLLIYVGGDSDEWVKKLDKAVLEGHSMKLMDQVKLYEEEETPGMEGTEHHHGDGEHADAHHHEGHEHAAIQEKDVEQRAMSEFGGAYKSLGLVFESGALDKAIEASAKEEGHSFDEEKAEVLKHYKTDYPYIKVDGEKLQLTDKDGKVQEEASYEAKGFNFESHGDHAHVWYQYEKKSGSEKLPKYLLFNDHGYKANQPKEEGHLAHIHLLYGNESFEKTLEQDTVPFYVDAAVKDEVLQEIFAPEEHEHAEEGHSHEHGEEGHHHHHHDGEPEMDEHVWTSPKLAQNLVQAIADRLSTLDPSAKEQFQANAKAYKEKLEKLDKDFQNVVDKAERKTIILGDRFPLRYFTEEYGLSYDAAFPGCSKEVEPSALGMANLTKKIKDEKIPVIFYLEFSDQKVAKALQEATGAKLLEFNSVHNVSKEDFDKGVDYLDLMGKNLEPLREALGTAKTAKKDCCG